MNINERPTSVNFRCTKAMVALGPFEGCVSESFELDVTKLRLVTFLANLRSDPDAQDTLTYWLRKSTGRLAIFIYNGNKLRVKVLILKGQVHHLSVLNILWLILLDCVLQFSPRT